MFLALALASPAGIILPMPQLENLQWETFCQHYALHFNGTRAALEAGFEAGEDNGSAATQAWSLLRNQEVQARVSELVEIRVSEFKLEAVSVLRELQKIAQCDIGQAFNEDGSLKPIKDIPEPVRKCIAGFETVEYFEGQGREKQQVGWLKKVKFWDKTKGLELLGKHFKLWLDKLELSADKSLEELLTRSWVDKGEEKK